MFKFNFFENQNENEVTTTDKKKIWKEAEKIPCTFRDLTEEEENLEINISKYGDIEITTLCETNVIDYLKEKGSECVLESEIQHSDLITAKYEGGFKIWECTIDLINYLENEKVDLKGKRILDLGCGCGILGIYCLLKGASVDFQDYNKEVIENITVPNVILNCDNNKEIFEKCNFYSGDWMSLKGLLEKNSYDIIVTSETIYNQENYTKLLNIFSENLKTNGIVYLAAKTYYFGVGGGTREFERVLEKYPKLNSSVVWKCEDGLKREILKIKKICEH